MYKTTFALLVLLIVSLACLSPARAASYYTARMVDPQAVYLTAPGLPVHGDGVGDDSTALQMAIDRVQESTRQGIVFVPEGKYRLTHTIFIWNGIRLIGYGQHRPVFLLANHAQGFQASGGKALLRFAGDRPAQGQSIPDSDAATCYSGLSNIDIDLGQDNSGAVAIRFHVGDQCVLSHSDIHVGSALGGIEEVGGQAQDLQVFGGQYGIIASRPTSPAPFLLLDSYFEGQAKAAIKTEETNLALIRVGFKDMPSAVTVDEARGQQLYVKDSRMENISGAAMAISDENNPRSQVNATNLTCIHVPLLLLFRESGAQVTGPGQIYEVRSFCHGLQIPDLGQEGVVRTTYNMAAVDTAPAPAASDIPALPDQGTWVNITTLGARGDGIADDTQAFKDAISRYRSIYVPSGRYRITDTLTLQPDTVLVGLDPATTQFVTPDNAPAFAGAGWHDTPSHSALLPLTPGAQDRALYQGIGGPKALIEAPKGGSDIVTGIGIDTGFNSRAVGIKWMAGAGSLLSDVVFLGGAGTYDPDGRPIPLYNSEGDGPADPNRPWDSQYESLWVTEGGGGVLQNIWSANPLAQSGAVISHTATAGTIYGLSLSGHVRNELRLRDVSNWQIVGLATHEGRVEGPLALPIGIDRASGVTFAALSIRRDAGMPSTYPFAASVHNGTGLAFLNMSAECPGKQGFGAALYDQSAVTGVPELEIAALTISGQTPSPRAPAKSIIRSADVNPEKLAGGFADIQGAAVDAAGDVYFVDPPRQDIYRWSPQTSELALVRDNPESPEALAFDRAGDLLVVGATGSVYAFRPDKDAEDEISPITPVPAVTRAGLAPILPLARYRESHDFVDDCTAAQPLQYVSPDGSVFVPASAGFPDCGPGHEEDTSIDLLRTFGVAAAPPGKPFYVADSFEQKTYSFAVAPDGSLGNPKLFAERGEAGTAVDSLGDVYVAAGRIYVYDPTGKEIDAIDVPERPTSLVFGGSDRQTLFICAGTSLYAMRMKVKGP